ncbi:DinB family protein [Chitinophaga arvensicola]|uniref:DinB superfamily protein n=1 Tax=Chitinophaga arvensicola TaxID=29529 RepID=A0A1I0QIZ9_9BACT|nr:DinB family protein [Chitinophaga arvensicola]SEW26996.1 DinB superfamily protein [Chitinophaga arvensicola]
MKRTEWFNRTFPIIEDNGILPAIIERLNGTPVRIKSMLHNVPTSLLTSKPTEKWSIQEEAGHLSDMEPLWLGRLEDLINGSAELRIADLTNQATHRANHNDNNIDVLLQKFSEQRKVFVDRLSQVTPSQLLSSSLHPRLKTPMRIIDLAYFVAEHDDHHLAGIRETMKQY